MSECQKKRKANIFTGNSLEENLVRIVCFFVFCVCLYAVSSIYRIEVRTMQVIEGIGFSLEEVVACGKN